MNKISLLIDKINKVFNHFTENYLLTEDEMNNIKMRIDNLISATRNINNLEIKKYFTNKIEVILNEYKFFRIKYSKLSQSEKNIFLFEIVNKEIYIYLLVENLENEMNILTEGNKVKKISNENI